MNSAVFASDLKETPYWWDEAPRPRLPSRELPTNADVAVVGSGYTGLSAALTLARNGRKISIIEAEDPGYGASSRNAGACGRTFRFTFGELLNRYGAERAVAVYKEIYAAHNYAVSVIRNEQISCHARTCGRYIAAVSPRHFERMAKDVELRRRYFPIQDVLVSPGEQDRMIGFGAYHGGRLIPDWDGIHPGLYQLGLLDRAVKAGVDIIANTAVSAIRRQNGQLIVQTNRGDVTARNVIVATNGYTGAATPYLRRRVVPFPAYMAASERLGKDVVRRLIPGGQIFSNSLENMFYIRESPDGERLLFGGLTGSRPPNLQVMGAKLHAELVKLIPELSQTRLTHVWTGKCSAAFSMFPHIGEKDGVHYATGYAFAGVAMGSYLGHKLALRILGSPDATTVFDEIPFEARPYHWGSTWFLPFATAYINIKDRLSL